MDTAQPSLRPVEGPDAAAQCRAYAATELRGRADDDVIADAQLVLTELVSNAQLHGRPPLLVGVTALGDGAARVEVSDAGQSRLVLPAHSTDAMTGRGLTVVAALAESWGVDPIAGGGKVVWAILRAGSSEHVEAPEVDIDALLAAWESEPEETEFTVRLGAVPTGLLLAAKQHIDNVVRELTLARAASTSPPAEFEALVDAVMVDFAQARAALKEQAAAAAACGARHTDLIFTLPASCVEAGARYLAALDEVDRYARTARILTLETPPLHRLFRRWYVSALIEQLRARAQGVAPEEPTPFVEVLAREVEELSVLRETAFRLDLLQRMNAALADVHTAEDLARTVISAAVSELGATTARVYLHTGDRLTAIGQDAAPEARVAAYDEVPLDAEIPSAIVFRTGRPIVVRNLARLGRQYPQLVGLFDSERALHVVPMQVGRRRLGVLGLAFPPSSQYDAAAQTKYVRALADVLAQSLVRIDTQCRRDGAYVS